MRYIHSIIKLVIRNSHFDLYYLYSSTKYLVTEIPKLIKRPHPIGYSTLTKWLKDFRESGDIPVRGSGNYSSDEQKEIARLRRELRDAQDALDVLKKAINILGK